MIETMKKEFEVRVGVLLWGLSVLLTGGCRSYRSNDFVATTHYKDSVGSMVVSKLLLSERDDLNVRICVDSMAINQETATSSAYGVKVRIRRKVKRRAQTSDSTIRDSTVVAVEDIKSKSKSESKPSTGFGWIVWVVVLLIILKLTTFAKK